MQELKEKNKAMEWQFAGFKQELAGLNIVQLREENLEFKKTLNELMNFSDFMDDFMAKEAKKKQK